MITPPPPPALPFYKGHIHPQFTDNTSSSKRAGAFTRIKSFLFMVLAAGFVGGIPFLIGYMEDITWLKWVGYIIAGLILLLAFTMKTKAAKCPYCNKKFTVAVGKALKGGDFQVECSHCYEWLVMRDDQLRAFAMEDAESLESFQAPTFQTGQWPAECIVCGLPPVRYEQLKSRKFNAGALLGGAVSMSKAGIANVPYCAEHSESLKLKIVDDHPRIVFSDYNARRRYLAVNRGQKAHKIK